MEQFFQTIAENWLELLTAIGTIAAILFGTKIKKTPEQKQQAKINKQEAKCEADAVRLKRDHEKLNAMKAEVKSNAGN